MSEEKTEQLILKVEKKINIIW